MQDQGTGIAAADRARIFDLFHRAAKGDGAPAGTGMGLAIVKGLVEAHGGSVAPKPRPTAGARRSSCACLSRLRAPTGMERT